jgi:hypothetical protein
MVLSYNPLSMLTPGFLRRIWEGALPNASNAPSNRTPASPGGSAGGSNQAAPATTPPANAQAPVPKGD